MANEKKGKSTTAFSQLSQEEKERREAANSNETRTRSMEIISRILVYMIFPTFIGGCGLFFSYIQYNYSEDPDAKPIDFDRDFVLPFVMSLVLVIVITIQTGGFSSYDAKPIVLWPKVIRKKKIVHKTVIVDDNGNEIDNPELLQAFKEKMEKIKSKQT